MDVGLVGLGKMGANLALNLRDHGHHVVGYDVDEGARRRAEGQGLATAESFDDLVASLEHPSLIWLMVPCGEPTDEALGALLPRMAQGDVLVDGGNSFYRDSVRHAEACAAEGIRFLDVGTSGGTSGARSGACLMVGGERETYEAVRPVLEDIACDGGLMYVGAAGSGHFVKMVHNGIEYGMMEAIGEGFEIVERSGYDVDLRALADVWAHGSVIRGWLIEIMSQQLALHPNLNDIEPVCDTNGEALWTVETALEQETPAPAIALALMARNATKDTRNLSARSVAAMRNGFGGHLIHESEEESHG